MRSSTETLVSALRILSRDIQTDDYVANAALNEAADRLEEVEDDNIRLEKEVDEIHKQYSAAICERFNTNKDLQIMSAYADKLAASLSVGCLPKDVENLREANACYVKEIETLKQEAVEWRKQYDHNKRLVELIDGRDDEIEDLKNEATHLAQYVRVLQEENELLEKKLSEQPHTSDMKKFAMNLDKLKDEVLFDLILAESKIAVGYSYKDFYTNAEGVPADWYNQFIDDMRNAVRYKYKGQYFYVVYTKSVLNEYDDNDLIDYCIAYIFFEDRVYALDNYYTDCEIFQSVLKSYF
jgi:hypothetical protein